MKPQRPDPAMMPSPAALSWFESEPDPIEDDLGLAVLMARVGMASNALSSHIEAALRAREHGTETGKTEAKYTRDMLVSLANAAAALFESIELAGKDMTLLRVLAKEGGLPDGAFKRVGELRAGNHPASEFIERARNQLAYHWDARVIEPVVSDFARNKRIVWLELDRNGNGVHTFASTVLANALFPELLRASELESSDFVNAVLEKLADAVGIVVEFFARSLAGYMKSYAVERRTRDGS